MNAFSLAQCLDFVQRAHAKNQTIVFTNGCFDLLHPGHVTYLEQAKALGDVLVVGINSDASVRRLKGDKRPIMDQQDRATVIGALQSVDAVVIFDEDTPISTLAALKPSIHTKGGDYQADLLPEYNTVVSNGGKVVILPFVEGCSTSLIIDRILSRYC